MIKPLALISGILALNTVLADGIVVTTLGSTVSDSAYVTPMQVSAKLNSAPSVQSLLASNFTVTSILTPGQVAPQKITQKTPIEPMYLVGTDEFSINWVNKYKEKLSAIHARGYLINVKNYADYQHFVKKTGLNLPPISGDLIAQHYHLTHYPVLITNNLIEQ
jgi:integrating conjugative element protein (TIGR03765 family)